MGKRGGGGGAAKKQREEVSRGVGGANVKSILRQDHLKKLALWCGGDASIPSLAAFFGHRFAADAEAAGIAPDPQLFSCLRCETVLQPGFNCTVRIEKNGIKRRRGHRKSNASSTQNNVVYNCHFCSHRNVKRGTMRGHMKEIYPTKPEKPPALPKTPKTLAEIVGKDKETAVTNNTASSPVRAGNDRMANSEATTPGPMANSEATTPGPTLLLDRSRRKRKLAGGRPAEPGSSCAATEAEKTISTSKRKRKSWTSLKEKADNDRSSNTPNLKIPFLLSSSMI